MVRPSGHALRGTACERRLCGGRSPCAGPPRRQGRPAHDLAGPARLSETKGYGPVAFTYVKAAEVSSTAQAFSDRPPFSPPSGGCETPLRHPSSPPSDTRCVINERRGRMNLRTLGVVCVTLLIAGPTHADEIRGEATFAWLAVGSTFTLGDGRPYFA